jgi:hypothetical protein
MNCQHSLHILEAAQFKGSLTHRHSRTSSVTTSWGVNWDEEFIARDLLQNFFDANRDGLAKVKVAVEGSTVTVFGPAPMELERLFYLGSEKGDDDIGKYGEGFKVAAVCLLRDHDIHPIVASRDDVLCIRMDQEQVAGTALRPLVYDFFTTTVPVNGTKLILRGCSQKLVRALEVSLSHFFYERNPLLGQKLWSSWNDHFAIYRAATTDGYVFYRRLRRGRIPDLPVVLVIDKQFERIEKKTNRDRDRNAFGEELMNLFYQVFARNGLRDALPGQQVVVEAARPCWQRGHPLLSEIADASRRDCWPAEIADRVFGQQFFARATSHDAAASLQYLEFEKAWQQQGRKPLPAYFRVFGVLNAQDKANELRQQALAERKQRHQRAPTVAERKSLSVLTETIRVLAPDITALLLRKHLEYSVAETEVLLGELKQHRHYGSVEVFLSAAVFGQDFAAALAVFLHEHTHVFGYDGSRGFTDALTQVIETVVRQRQHLDEHEAAWLAARKAVLQERNGQPAPDIVQTISDLVAAMHDGELRDLLGRLPTDIVWRALEEQTA